MRMAAKAQDPESNWKRKLHCALRRFGHRNWIVVADSAYPEQSRAGIETVVADESQLAAVREVLDAIAAATHVRATVYLDQELEYVAEEDAPGALEYRKALSGLLAGAKTITLPHEQIIARLDATAQLFNVLIVKTNLAIPYTSVFFELDCGYWSAEAEGRLRAAMASRTS